MKTALLIINKAGTGREKVRILAEMSTENDLGHSIGLTELEYETENVVQVGVEYMFSQISVGDNDVLFVDSEFCRASVCTQASLILIYNLVHEGVCT